MRNIFIFLTLLSVLTYSSASFALPLFLGEPANTQSYELTLASSEYGEEQSFINSIIGTGHETYGLAKWMWGIMASFTGALMFGSFKMITWYEHRKYDREKANKAKPDRTARFLGDVQEPQIERDAKPKPAPGKRRVIAEGQPLFGGK